MIVSKILILLCIIFGVYSFFKSATTKRNKGFDLLGYFKNITKSERDQSHYFIDGIVLFVCALLLFQIFRIDPATPPGKKGPNYTHYHKDGKKPHYSPRPGDKDPGF